MRIARFDAESPDYAKLRDELHDAEIALRDQRERVAALRRALPQDGVIENQTFEELCDGVRLPVTLSDLCPEPGRSLVLMHFMYGKQQQTPCPMCTLWADGYDGIVPHLQQRVDFAVLVAGDAGAFAEYGRQRGWSHLRLLSAADSDLKRRLGFETEEGQQHPGVSIFRRSESGDLIHAYSLCAMLGSGEFRGMDLLSPLWHFLDLTPEGRGDFMPRKRYD
ncbi:MAG: DUF899 domain-containing protein [Proteobacteria bacterium]|nr:DUF899 domain-containing protein [Pseudomonadota bacterium]